MDSIRHVNVAPPSDANVQLRGTEEQLWSGRRGSNPQPPAWEADALPLSYSRTSTTITRQSIALRLDAESVSTIACSAAQAKPNPKLIRSALSADLLLIPQRQHGIHPTRFARRQITRQDSHAR